MYNVMYCAKPYNPTVLTLSNDNHSNISFGAGCIFGIVCKWPLHLIRNKSNVTNIISGLKVFS